VTDTALRRGIRRRLPPHWRGTCFHVMAHYARAARGIEQCECCIITTALVVFATSVGTVAHTGHTCLWSWPFKHASKSLVRHSDVCFFRFCFAQMLQVLHNRHMRAHHCRRQKSMNSSSESSSQDNRRASACPCRARKMFGRATRCCRLRCDHKAGP